MPEGCAGAKILCDRLHGPRARSWATTPGLHHRIAGWYRRFGLSEREKSDAHAHAQPGAHAHAHGHSHDHAHAEHAEESPDEDDGEPTSTGFLPLGLAISLFVTGLFVLGLIPGVQCGG